MLGSEVLKQNHLRSFTLLEFFPVGITLVFFGFIYLVFWGRHYLTGTSLTERLAGTSLADVYRLKERLFTMSIPQHSRLAGKSLRGLRLGEVLDLEVLAIRRHGSVNVFFAAEDPILGGDELLIRGRSKELQKMLRISTALIRPLSELLSASEQATLGAARFTVSKKSSVRGKKISELSFRAAYGFYIVSLTRDGERLSNAITDQSLIEDDIVVAVGPLDKISALQKEFDAEPLSLSELSDEIVFGIKLPASSTLDHVAIRESGFNELLDLTIIGIKRGQQLLLSVSGEQEIIGDDIILVAGNVQVPDLLTDLIEISITEDTSDFNLEQGELLLQEVVLSPRSKLIGRSLDHIRFTATYGIRVLGIWRNGEPKRTKFKKIPLQFGDALLLQGTRERMATLARDIDFVFLSDDYATLTRPNKAVWAISALVTLVLLSAFHVFAAPIVALIATSIVVLSGTIRMDEAYREIDWRLMTMLGFLLPFETAFSRYGVTKLIADTVFSCTAHYSSFVLVLVLTIVTCALAQALDSTLAVIVVAPVAIQLATHYGFAPQPLVMAVSVAASLGFLSPFSHRAHLLILGPGGYNSRDFFKVGFVLTIITVLITATYGWIGL